MSWDSYLENLVAQSGDASGQRHCSKGFIIGIDGGQWTTDASDKAFIISPDEISNIADCFKSKDFTPFMANGVHIGGTKYQFLREEDGKIVLAKKKNFGAICLQASKTALVGGFCPEGMQAGNLNKAVAVIAEYLESLGM